LVGFQTLNLPKGFDVVMKLWNFTDFIKSFHNGLIIENNIILVIGFSLNF
jgi:hypothetical protein